MIEGTANKMLLALQGGLASLDLVSGKVDNLVELEKAIPGNRTNDGACDATGRLWIGTMELSCKEGAGSLYTVDNNLQVQKKLGNLSISNGIAWTADNKRMYHIDTTPRTVNAYSFDAAKGSINFEKTVITVPDGMGSPDGMCMDEEGMLWIAHWGGFGIYRWDPGNGRLLEKLDVPVPQVTSCAFGGDNMQHLLITTAKEGLPAEDLEKYPGSGHTFIATPGAKGMKQYKFPGIQQQS